MRKWEYKVDGCKFHYRNKIPETWSENSIIKAIGMDFWENHEWADYPVFDIFIYKYGKPAIGAYCHVIGGWDDDDEPEHIDIAGRYTLKDGEF